MLKESKLSIAVMACEGVYSGLFAGGRYLRPLCGGSVRLTDLSEEADRDFTRMREKV